MAVRAIKANYTVPLSGFANPRYIASDPTDATGFIIEGSYAVLLSVISMGTTTVVAEQTLDYNGATGWFPVLGRRLDDTGSLFMTGLAAAKAYSFPVQGVRMRFRVTALASADLVCTLGLASDLLDLNTQPVTAVTVNTSTNVLGRVVGAASATNTNAIQAAGRLVTAGATVNATLLKSTAGVIYKIRGYNAAAAVRYLKLYNKATAPTVGTDTPAMTIPLAASAVFDLDFGMLGYYFSTGIGYGLTTGVADADATALTAADIVGMNTFYA